MPSGWIAQPRSDFSSPSRAKITPSGLFFAVFTNDAPASGCWAPADVNFRVIIDADEIGRAPAARFPNLARARNESENAEVLALFPLPRPATRGCYQRRIRCAMKRSIGCHGRSGRKSIMLLRETDGERNIFPLPLAACVEMLMENIVRAYVREAACCVGRPRRRAGCNARAA